MSSATGRGRLGAWDIRYHGGFGRWYGRDVYQASIFLAVKVRESGQGQRTETDSAGGASPGPANRS